MNPLQSSDRSGRHGGIHVCVYVRQKGLPDVDFSVVVAGESNVLTLSQLVLPEETAPADVLGDE